MMEFLSLNVKKENLLFFLLVLLLGCRQNSEFDLERIDSDIDKLTTVKSQKEYLEFLADEDQRLRQNQSSKIVLEFGQNSKEDIEFTKKFNTLDSLNFIKIDRYLLKHGHPGKNKHGSKASMAPWAIIHHSNSLEGRNKHFIMLYQAYKNGDLDYSAFSLYLGRTYQMVFGKRFQTDGKRTQKEEIEAVIIALGLKKFK